MYSGGDNDTCMLSFKINLLAEADPPLLYGKLTAIQQAGVV